MCKKPFFRTFNDTKRLISDVSKMNRKTSQIHYRMVDNTLIDFSVKVSRSVEVSFVSFGSQIYEVACYRPYHCPEESCVKFSPLHSYSIGQMLRALCSNCSCSHAHQSIMQILFALSIIYDEIMLLR